MVEICTGAIHLEDNYGAHTLRKTRGYIQRTKYGMGFEIVCNPNTNTQDFFWFVDK